MTPPGPQVEHEDASPPRLDAGQDGAELLGRVYADAFLGLVRAGDAVFRALDRSLQDEYGISLHEYEVLLFLAVFSTDQTMPMLELRRRTPLSQSRVSRVVKSLEDDGFVRRTIDPADRRAVTVALTPRGLQKYRAARDRHLHDLDRHLYSVLTEQEITQLADITTKILAAQQQLT